MKPGNTQQSLILVKNHPIASLICFELAYPALIRKQLQEGQWIVSISDAGWFGHSLAIYQQLQMAQVLSKMASRYQIMANNDGLSSLINTDGKIIASLPAFQEGILRGQLFSSAILTPWVAWGDAPTLLFALGIISLCIILTKRRSLPLADMSKRGYPYQP